ncbi:hypothetical protein N7E81_05665 [Reichenbachiella carrageenanivorans]|uniref:Right handed beta helix region n=1 Tax=Reichenbachiella carrageenanivorans TaxID=2979869 RepID=A0ABY6D9M8_9BACT|nr:hypothetical protein [Reichenbachiella carrageenanivorans]UXX80585.1 hypothetical protein N7E81_05665 [Reichenbachiella carrageenanivorans]
MKAIKHLILLLVLSSGVFLGCQPNVEEISTDTSLQLSYSTDTVTFDTLFSSLGSITKRLQIYNTHDEAINITQLSLGTGDQSPYNLTVNGFEGNSFENEVIFGKDSLLILVEVIIDPNNQDLPFLVKDDIQIEYNTKKENVNLVAWGQDAIFINNEAITCNTTWTKDRPYIIYDSAWVDTGCKLTVEAGAKIYIDNGAIFTIAGSLDIQGTTEDKVLIANTRLDAKYDEAPGQWGSILFYPGSIDNSIDHAIIKNGTTGLTLSTNLVNGEGAELLISNTSIHFMSSSGIAAYTGQITAFNLEVFSCKDQLVAGLGGGSYVFNHCTFSNDPNDFTREGPSVIFTNALEFNDGSTYPNDLTLSLTNSIVWGREDEELTLDLSANTALNVQVQNNIIRSSDDTWIDLGNDISQENNYPKFYKPALFNYQIDSLSPAREAATASSITHDLLGTLRDAKPDIGAYERKDSIP